ncbi:uncharacterized, partial [Tachysurus ichikawai]
VYSSRAYSFDPSMEPIRRELKIRSWLRYICKNPQWCYDYSEQLVQLVNIIS